MGKIIEDKQVQELIKIIASKKSVLVGGCFDIVHLGHIEFLEKAKKEGEVLIVLLESDENIKKSKGDSRPINKLDDRAHFLSKLRDVDYVVKFPGIKNDGDYDELVRRINPSVIAITEGDKRIDNKKRQAEEVGAKLIEVSKLIPQQSSSQIIETISKEE